MRNYVRNIILSSSLLIFSKLAFAYGEYSGGDGGEGLAEKTQKAGGVSPALASYLQELTKNLNDFVTVGFVIVCVTSAISLLFTQDNVVKLLSKVAFGLFLLKMSALALNVITS